MRTHTSTAATQMPAAALTASRAGHHAVQGLHRSRPRRAGQVTAFNFGGFGKKTRRRSRRRSRRRPYPSVALPWTTTNLDGSLVGDVGFDPLGFSKYAPGAWWQGDEGDGSLKIFREAELMHGRIAQLACLGWVFPELAHFPGKDGAFGKMNPFEAVDAIPNAGWYQILAFMASLEVYRVNKLKDPSYVPGDLSLGQGPGRWNPSASTTRRRSTPRSSSRRSSTAASRCSASSASRPSRRARATRRLAMLDGKARAERRGHEGRRLTSRRA